MTSKIIVAIAAAVLSLAAPVAVEAQTLTVARNLVSGMQINYSGFTVGTTYRFASCSSSYFAPASWLSTAKADTHRYRGGMRAALFAWSPTVSRLRPCLA